MEGKLVQIIVKRILQELNPHHLHVGEYIVGHESLLEELESTLDLDMKSNDVRMMGIHGMGGIGKTSLVKALYNKISSKFEAYSFLFNVRGTSLVSLQQQLLKDIFQSDETFTHESKGTQLIKEKIGNKKVLVILDDVDSRDQLKALVGSRDWFRKGSRIIITTRDTEPLNKQVNRDELYELLVLNHDDSKKLFCYHAFGNEKPSISNKYAEMCDEALSFIKGLPLALEVLGSQFFDLKTEKEWRGWLARLKEIQHTEIFEKLKLSYDSLDDSEKKVFLDITCFFVGTRTRTSDGRWNTNIPFEVDVVKQFWEECGFHPEPAINVLKHKSLIKINKWNKRKSDYGPFEGKFGECFEMHDQIRDMGRKIVEDEEKKGKSCSRLWKNPKVIQTLQKQREMEVLPDWIGSSSKLEILELSQCFNTSRFPFVMLKKLKRLHLCAMQMTVTPDFSFAPYLEELTLRNCEMLTEVHESVGTLVNLKSLKITGCNALEGLPEAICHLTSLKSLELRQYVGCWSVGEEIIRLENRGLRDTRIKSILSSLEQLTKLENVCIYKDLGGTNVKRIEFEMPTLEISGLCLEWVTALPSSFLHSVKALVIINDQIEELPDSIAQVQNLEHLIFECGSLKAMPNWIGQLNRLHTFQPKFGRWRYPTQPEWIGGLQKLSLRGCQNIKHLPDIGGQMEGLERLDLSETGIVELPPWLGCLTNLTHLNLSTTHQNDYLVPDLSHLTSLEELDLSGRNFGSSPSCISNFPRLRVLNVSGCKQLRSIPHLSSSDLEELLASNCTNLRGLPDFSNLQSLRRLFVGGCNLLECIPGFKTIAENLSHLELPGPSGACSNLSDDFRNNVFMGARFRYLRTFKMEGNIIAGSHSGQQCLSFLFPDVRFNLAKCSALTLRLQWVSSPVDIQVITKDDLVLFKTTLPENDFDDGYKTFSSEVDEDILEHVQEGSGTIQVLTDVSELSRVELEAEFLPRY